MAEQTELDLPSPAPQPAAAAKRAIFAGFSSVQIVAGLLVIGVLIWGMWVTKALITPKQERIVSARLSSIVGEYVQAQRSEEHTSELQSLMRISYAVFCLNNKRYTTKKQRDT